MGEASLPIERSAVPTLVCWRDPAGSPTPPTPRHARCAFATRIPRRAARLPPASITAELVRAAPPAGVTIRRAVRRGPEGNVGPRLLPTTPSASRRRQALLRRAVQRRKARAESARQDARTFAPTAQGAGPSLSTTRRCPQGLRTAILNRPECASYTAGLDEGVHGSLRVLSGLQAGRLAGPPTLPLPRPSAPTVVRPPAGSRSALRRPSSARWRASAKTLVPDPDRHQREPCRSHSTSAAADASSVEAHLALADITC